MGMFDDYDPGPMACPLDGVALDGWQGKDGPCVMDRYKVGDQIDLPGYTHAFEMHASHGQLGAMHFVEAFGFTIDGVWIASGIVSVHSGFEQVWPDDLWNIGNDHDLKIRRGGVTRKAVEAGSS